MIPSTGNRRNGAPLIMLLALMAGWTGFRLVTPQLLGDGIDQTSIVAPVNAPPTADAIATGANVSDHTPARPARRPAMERVFPDHTAPLPHPAPMLWRPEPAPLAPRDEPAPLPAPESGYQPYSAPIPSSVAAGHNALMLAALGSIDLAMILSSVTAPQPQRSAAADPPPTPARSSLPLWSADGWVLWRGGSSSPSVSSSGFAPSYGGSQAGAVLRYRLNPASARRPEVYLRATSALVQRERAVAAGLSIRPAPRLPVRLAAEARLQDDTAGARVRPVVMAITELAPARLPFGFTAESYAAAGYAGGRGGGAFGDAQITAERPIAGALHGGGGIWAGGQQNGAAKRDIGRVDIGPRASVRLDLGGQNARIAVDWRQRVAGNAAPKSGAAITLSAGF